MKALQQVLAHLSTAGELLSFVWQRRVWLVPLVLVLLVIGLLIALASASAIAPFIYTLF
jgi:hypothetical protein